VVLDHQRLLMTEVLRSEDGHAQERRWRAQVLHHVGEEQLWSEERHCCPRGLLCGLARRSAACVVRQHGQ
jgi:hypothetical protein